MNDTREILREMAGVSLPVVRKTLAVESTSGVPFDQLKPGMVITFPNKKGKQFLIVEVAKFGRYIYYVEFKGQLEMASKDELSGAMVKEHGGIGKPIEV